MPGRRKPTRDALEIIHRRFFEGQPDRMVELEEARAAALIARELYDLREKAGWSHRELARRAGTTQAAIRRLEDADYDDQPLEILQRTAHVLGRRVDMRLRPMRSKRKTA